MTDRWRPSSVVLKATEGTEDEMDWQEYDAIRRQTRRMHPLALREYMATLRDIRTLPTLRPEAR